jgi:hypothetical protein
MRTPIALGLLCFAGLASPAAADSEQAVSVGLGYATFSVPVPEMDGMEATSTSPSIGGSLAGSYERAIGTDFALRAELAFGMFYGGTVDEGQSKRSYALLGDIGAAYRFDVFRHVPYAFAGLGAVHAGGGPIESGTDFVLVVGGGLDYLLSRKRSLGGELRLASFGGDITVFTACVRGTIRWGFF